MELAAHSWRVVSLAAGQSPHRKARAFPARQHRVSCHAVNDFAFGPILSPQQCNACTISDQQHKHLSIDLWTNVLLDGPDLINVRIRKCVCLYTTAPCRCMSSFHLAHPRYCAGDLASWCWWMMLTGSSGGASRHCISALPAAQIAVIGIFNLPCNALQPNHLTFIHVPIWLCSVTGAIHGQASSECLACTRVKLGCFWMQWHVRYNSWRRRYHCFHINIAWGLRFPSLQLSPETRNAIHTWH